MGLAPSIDIEIVEETIQPSKTYKLDFKTGRIIGMVDGKEAIKQFIAKTLLTERNKYLIYDDQYGIEMENLKTGNYTDDLIISETKRVITEALIYDERILSVDYVEATKEGDELFVVVKVSTIFGDSEVSINLTQGEVNTAVK